MSRRVDVPTVSKRKGIVAFFGEIISELRKVTWPTRQETLRMSIIVLIIAILVGLALGLIDIGFASS